MVKVIMARFFGKTRHCLTGSGANETPRDNPATAFSFGGAKVRLTPFFYLFSNRPQSPAATFSISCCCLF